MEGDAMKPRQSWAGLLVLGAALTVAGCLGEPSIEERWTLLELESPDPVQGDPFAQGGSADFAVAAKAVYREIFSGFLVAELRYSDSLTVNDVVLDPEGDDTHLAVAREVDRILGNSVTAGRNARAVVGFDHLVQRVDLSFTAFDPRGTTGGNGAFFLLLYLAHGEEIELESGADSLVLDPILSSELEVLSTGAEVGPLGP
jgi:hypothetical protein